LQGDAVDGELGDYTLSGCKFSGLRRAGPLCSASLTFGRSERHVARGAKILPLRAKIGRANGDSSVILPEFYDEN